MELKAIPDFIRRLSRAKLGEVFVYSCFIRGRFFQVF
jgi:hypothetical protein